MRLPALFINFKTYEQATGTRALELAKIAEAISQQENKSIVLVVQPTDLRMIANSVSLPVFAQHIDPVTYGAHTGAILPEAVKQAGASGTILNHAENKRSNDFLEKAIIRAKECSLTVMCCAESLERAKQIANFGTKPDIIAIEPPELVGSGIAVSKVKPGLIVSIIEEISKIADIPVIAGAGIKDASDVKKALELGCSGVFVASAIVKAEDKKKAILNLLSGFE